MWGGVGSSGGKDPDGLAPLFSSLRPETRRAAHSGPVRRAAPGWCPNSQAHRCAAQAGPQAPAAVHMQPGWRTRGEGWSGGLNDRARGGSCGCGQGALVLGVLWWLSEVATLKAATEVAMC